MYHFHFNLPANEQNSATIYLPSRNHIKVPIIISTYGWGKDHWQKRVHEDFLDLAVNKNNLGVIRLDLTGDSDDASQDARDRWASAMFDMIAWVKKTKYVDPNVIGLFAYGLSALSALDASVDNVEVAFAAINPITEYQDIDGTKKPIMILKGTGEKVELQLNGKMTKNEVIAEKVPNSEAEIYTFVGSDDYCYQVSKQAANEVIKWIKSRFEVRSELVISRIL